MKVRREKPGFSFEGLLCTARGPSSVVQYLACNCCYVPENLTPFDTHGSKSQPRTRPSENEPCGLHTKMARSGSYGMERSALFR